MPGLGRRLRIAILALLAMLASIPLTPAGPALGTDAPARAPDGDGATARQASNGTAAGVLDERAWSQDGGAPGRNRLAETAFPIDLVANGTLEREDGVIAASSQAASWGDLAFLATSPDTCTIHAIDLARRASGVINASACPSYTLLSGIDPPRGQAVTCRFVQQGDAPLLRGVDLVSGEERWRVRPADLAMAAANGTRWSCRDTVLAPNDTRLYAAVQSSAPNTDVSSRSEILMAVNLTDGTIEVSKTAGAPEEEQALQDGLRHPDRSRSVTTHGLSIVDGAWLVRTGSAPCQACTSASMEGVVEWYQLPELRFQGDARATTASDDPDTETVGVSDRAAALDGRFTVALGETLAIVDPAASEPQVTESVQALEDTSGDATWPTPVWTPSSVVLPYEASLLALDPSTLETRWGWTTPQGQPILDVIATEDGQLHVLLLGEQDQVGFVTVSIRTGRPAQQLTLDVPWRPAESPGRGEVPTMVPVGDQVLVQSTTAPFGYVLLGPGDPGLAPDLTISSQQPGVGEPVTLTLTAPAEPVDRYEVHWGDGTNRTLANETVGAETQLRHTYDDEGTHTITVSSIDPRGRTSTTEREVDVGAPPDPELNLFQKAFARENQDMTFGLLGLVLTLGGAGISLYRRKRRLSRLEDELSRLDEIRERSREQPREGVRALEAYRDRIETELADGDIDDGQFGVLERRRTRLNRLLRDRLLAPFEAKLSPSFKRLLDASLEDGVITLAEADELKAQLEAEAMDEADRRSLREVLELWIRDDPSDPADPASG